MSHTIIIFGASGDLTRRKLIPALYQLHRKGRLPDSTKIVGVSRTRMTDEQWRCQLGDAAGQFLGDAFANNDWDDFARWVHYRSADVTEPEDFRALAEALDELEGNQPCTRLYYLAMMPKLYGPTVHQLGAAGMAEEDTQSRRVVIEKPFNASRFQ